MTFAGSIKKSRDLGLILLLNFKIEVFPFDLVGKEPNSVGTPVPSRIWGTVSFHGSLRGRAGGQLPGEGCCQEGSTTLLLRAQMKSSNFVQQVQIDGPFKQEQKKKKEERGTFKSKINLIKENKIRLLH